MLEELLSDKNINQKIEIAKYAAIFAGGILVGYSIKKVLDSYDFDVVKSNVTDIIDEYNSSKSEYIDVMVEDAVDVDDKDM